MSNTTLLPTNKGNLSFTEIMDIVIYGSYASNRDSGLSHEALVSIGLGNDEFEGIYNNEKLRHANQAKTT